MEWPWLNGGHPLIDSIREGLSIRAATFILANCQQLRAFYLSGEHSRSIDDEYWSRLRKIVIFSGFYHERLFRRVRFFISGSAFTSSLCNNRIHSDTFPDAGRVHSASVHSLDENSFTIFPFKNLIFALFVHFKFVFSAEVPQRDSLSTSSKQSSKQSAPQKRKPPTESFGKIGESVAQCLDSQCRWYYDGDIKVVRRT